MADGYHEVIVTPQMSPMVEAQWRFKAKRDGKAFILPDGRCDIILQYNIHTSSPLVTIVTGAATKAYTVSYVKGDCWQGLRMRPEYGRWLWGENIRDAA